MNILDIPIKATLDLPITLSTLSDIPGAVGSFLVDKVVDFLKDDLLNPLKKGFEAVGNVCCPLVLTCGLTLETARQRSRRKTQRRIQHGRA